MWVYDATTLRFLEVNRAAIEQYGYTREEFLEMHLGDIRPPEDRAAFYEHVGKHRDEFSLRRQWTHLVKPGRRIEVEITSHTLSFEGTAAVLVVAQDVTERLALETQLRQAQKMEAVGRLAGGVAHDFNNLLTAILGYAELIEEQLPPGHALERDVAEILKAGTSAAALTSQLLAFSRKQVLRPQAIDLNAVIAHISGMLGRVIGEHITLETSLAAALPPVTADRGQIEQIVMNLAVNARDAMPAGGRLTIETRAIVLDDDYAGEHPDVAPGSYVMLAVSDTGTGMDEETRAHMFEPFFTTKSRGEGTGLGLATVYGIVKQSGGAIAVYSEPGLGTSFKIYLPRGSGDTASAPDASPPLEIGGTETILVAEDQREVRAVARAILQRHGYRVIEAANGAEALAHLAAGEPIDLLLTDIVMPDMTGPEVAAQARLGGSSVRVLYTSGYASDAVIKSGVLSSDAAFIQKPYAGQSLLQTVRRVLSKGRDV
jgi:PAS domain S-box-containing protein